jgi:hypothetical protein
MASQFGGVQYLDCDISASTSLAFSYRNLQPHLKSFSAAYNIGIY